MRYLILFLVLLNIVVFLLPKESQRTVHSYTRGEPGVPMLERLDEQDAPPTRTSLVAPGIVHVADEEALETVAAAPDGETGTDDAESGQVASNGQPEESAAAAEADNTVAEPEQIDEEELDKIASQGNFDKLTGNGEASGITSVEPAESGAIKRGPLQCYSLGPFRDRKEADRLMAKMVKKGVKPALRTAKVREPSAYWVYLPPRATREQAVETVDRLEALGFDDYFIVGDAKYNNAISLGLFTYRKGSQQRVRDLKEMGFEAKVETRYSENDVYWIDYSSHGEIDWKPIYRSLKNADKIRNVKRDCE